MPVNNDTIKIIIVGAGKAGELIAEDIRERQDANFEIVGFVDDNPSKQGKTVGGAPVLGTGADLPALAKEHEVEEIFIAIPSERGKAVRDIIERTAGMKLTYKILPRRSEVLMQEFTEDYLHYIRKVRVEDMLGGEILKSDQQEITDFARPQTILITGAAGSIGSELSRQIAAHKPKRVVFYDWWENGMFALRNELVEAYPKGNFEFIIGDIKDHLKIDQVMKTFKPDTVFHAAAYKHVPLMEYNGAEAIKNNIIGTKTVAEASIKHGAKKFIMVSTDKAVNPTNIMGASKRAAEMVIHTLAESQTGTALCSVRFGNVINSNGSAIPIFEKQIDQGGPVTVTHKDMTRFFMTIPEAVHLILQAWVMGESNDLFVLDMGESIRIYDLAKLLITLQGYVPEKEIKIKIVGTRPGEKLYEEVLLKQEETKATAVKKIFRTQNFMDFDKLSFLNHLSLLVETVEDDGLNVPAIRERLQQMVATYKPAKH
ncbi:MAG: UDP-N-acetylglucosamine 4,6-dehydratase [Candidatus Saccharibacteria bacterium]|nr:UDP-N-acetylglucosamine 4,6-dehydratase [Candidatus Saccharibacteria bacterium]